MKVNRFSLAILFLLQFYFSVLESANSIPNQFIPDSAIYSTCEKVVFLQSDPNTHRGMPILQKADTLLQKGIPNEFIQNSFPGQSIKLYFLIQNYLYNTEQISNIEPLYLLLSENQGGFAKKGFYLRDSSRNRINKSNVYYVDIRKSVSLTENYLGSFTQMFPHECGHIFYNLLSENDQLNLPKSQNIHFSGIITDYRTAFDEGFAIHFENISRQYEPVQKVKDEINKDAKNKEAKIERLVRGYERDFYFSFRLDYYRITSVFWYNSFEMLKRYFWVRHNWFKYKSKPSDFQNAEKALFYRNSAIRPDTTKLKNYHQVLSTEGVIASFFEKLTMSKVSNNYLEKNFYEDFLNQPLEFLPKEAFNPLENEYLKIFIVINKYLKNLKLGQSPFLEFIEGYLCEFPDEKGVVMKIFQETTGYYFNTEIGPEIWLLNEEHKHGRLIFDQFGGNRDNFYLFNLNAADREDLLTYKELQRSDIQEIIKYRENQGRFDSVQQIATLKNISENSSKALINSLTSWEKSHIENEKIKIWPIFLYGIARLLEKSLFYLMLFIIFYYLLFYGKRHVIKLLTAKYVIRKTLKLFILIFLGLLSVILSNEPLQLFLIISVLFIAIELLSRKRERYRRDAFYTSFVIILMIMFSLW